MVFYDVTCSYPTVLLTPLRLLSVVSIDVDSVGPIAMGTLKVQSDRFSEQNEADEWANVSHEASVISDDSSPSMNQCFLFEE